MEENLNPNQTSVSQEVQPSSQVAETQPLETERKFPSVLPRNLLERLKTFASRDKLKVIIPRAIVILVFLLILVVVIPRILKMFKKDGKPTLTPIPTSFPQSTPEVFKPSPYANDEEVLAIEKAIEALEKDLKIVNFREDALMIPSVDWDVNFN